MTQNPRVGPSESVPTHDISFDGEDAKGYRFAKAAEILHESPLHSATRFWTVRQNSWLEGLGRITFSQNPAGLHDAQDLWGMTDGALFPSLQWKRARGIRSEDLIEPGSVLFKPLIDTDGMAYWIDVAWVSSGFTADKAYILVRKVGDGNPGTATVILTIDSGGDPDVAAGHILKTVTFDNTIITDKVSVWVELYWTTTQVLTASATYHLYITSSGGDDASHFEVGVNDDGSASKVSSTGLAGSWSAAGYSMYIHVVDADIQRIFYDFELEGAIYIVDRKDSGAASELWINGDRGIATSGSTTSIVCSGKSWVADRWIGARVRCYDGAGDGQSAVLTDNDGTSLSFAAQLIAFDNTSKFIIYETPWWTKITGHGLGIVTGKPAVANNMAYFPQGISDYIIRMKVNGSSYTFADDGTSAADLVGVNVANGAWQLVAIWKSSCLVYTAPVPTTWANAAWVAGSAVGGIDYNPTNIVSADGVLYILKEDGPYVVSGNNIQQMSLGFGKLPSRHTGVACCFHNKIMYISFNGSILSIQGGTATDILNYKTGFYGLPNDRRGYCSALIPAGGWVFAGIDGGASNWSSVLAYNGIGWHELMRGIKAGARIRNIFWQACPEGNNRLWVNMNGAMFFMVFPGNGANPLRDSTCTFQHEAVATTTPIDMDELALHKFVSILRTVAENLTNGSIELDYQLDDECGGSTWYPFPENIVHSPDDNAVFNRGGIFRISLRLRIRSTSASTPPILRSWSLEGLIKSTEKWRWVVVLKFGPSVTPKSGGQRMDVSEDLQWLKDRAARADKLTVHSSDPALDGKIVTIESPTRVVRKFVQGKWAGEVTITISEA